MDRLTLLTDQVSPDEMCWWLVEAVTTPLEITKKLKGLKLGNMEGQHRFQIVTVVRGDKLVRHVRDMGDTSLYDCGGLNVPGLLENTVAELREIADQWRSDQRWERDILANEQGESTLLERWVEQADQKAKSLQGLSVFGSGVTVQR